MRLAALMVDARRGDPQYNLGRLEHLLQRAAEAGAEVACTQEGCLEGYIVQRPNLEPEAYAQLAEPIPDGPRFLRIRDCCARLGLFLIVGLAERTAEGIYNSAALIGSDGEVLGVFRKIHNLGVERLNLPGNQLPVFETPFGMFGVLICSDRHYPEAARVLALRGARVLFLPSWGFRGNLNTAVLRTRAHENRYYVVFVHPDETCIVDPKGRVMLQEIGGGRAVTCDLDLDGVEGLSHPYLRLRRPDLYGPLVADGGDS